MRQNLTVTQAAGDRRLDQYLATELGLSRSLIQRWLREGAVTVNSRAERASYLVQPGDEIVLESSEAPSRPAIQPPDLPVIYEDDDIWVIDKPAGIAVHPGAGRAGEATVADWARGRTTDPDPARPGIVHRLDRDTSGLLVVAKSAEAKDWLQQRWRERSVHKTYQLLTIGRVDPEAAVIKLPLDRDPANPIRRRVMPTGKPAVTRYETLAAYPGYTLIQAYPETGRTHQLRVHFAAVGHPIAGDVLYGPPKRPLGLSRQFLHASRLELAAPSGRQLDIASPLPKELTSILSRLDETYNK